MFAVACNPGFTLIRWKGEQPAGTLHLEPPDAWWRQQGAGKWRNSRKNQHTKITCNTQYRGLVVFYGAFRYITLLRRKRVCIWPVRQSVFILRCLLDSLQNPPAGVLVTSFDHGLRTNPFRTDTALLICSASVWPYYRSGPLAACLSAGAHFF